MPKTTCKVMLCRFPGGFSEHPDSSEWMMKTLVRAGANKLLESGVDDGAHVSVYESTDPRIDKIASWYVSDTPIDMVRNKALLHAKKWNVDYVLFLDNDMKPDQTGDFWQSSFDWIFNREAPSMIAAPYVGGGTYHNNIFVFQWANLTNDPASYSLEQVSREEAANMNGIQPAAALPTGLLLLDMRMLERMSPPYFYYEFTDREQHTKAGTEDVTFTRDASLLWSDVEGAGCWCNWDTWAEHIKLGHCGKPKRIDHTHIGKAFRDACQAAPREGVVDINAEFPDINQLRELGVRDKVLKSATESGSVDPVLFEQLVESDFSDLKGRDDDKNRSNAGACRV